MSAKTSIDHSEFIWSIADSLRGAFKQSEYGRVILPFAVLRRLECVLAEHKETTARIVEETHDKPEALRRARLENATGLPFYTTSPLSLEVIDGGSLRTDLLDYLNGFSPNVQEIFEHFQFKTWIDKLDKEQRLAAVVQHFIKEDADLSPAKVSNHQMGTIFEHLIRKFAESSNETAGEHFTPRDVVRLTTFLTVGPDEHKLKEPATLVSVYDGTAGSGGFLSAAYEHMLEMNPDIDLSLHGQELNRESYAIGLSDMLLLGQDTDRYKLGDTLNNDQFDGEYFHYGLTNPPFGVNWGSNKTVREDVQNEAERGHSGRFGAGLPTIRDGSMLFLQNMLAKMMPLNKKNEAQSGGRIGIILSGSPLFNGNAGSGESEIRRHILENDWLEAIVALPTNLFYNTGIGTYIWVLSNRKEPRRKNKVQLIDATDMHSPMRKSHGDKRHFISDEDIERILSVHAAFTENDALPKAKIFQTTDFGYRRITIRQPLRLRFHITAEGMDEYASIKSAKFVEELAELEGQKFETVKELLAAAKIPKITKTIEKRIWSAFGVADEDAPILWKNKKKKEMEIDSSRTETENVPLGECVHEYFEREVKPHVPDAWIDASKTDPKDGQIGEVGYEINFNRYFYEYNAPRPLEEIDADLRAIEAEIAKLLAEVVR